MRNFVRTYLKKWWVITILVVAALVILVIVVQAQGKAPAYTYITVSPTTVSAGVSVTGNVKSAATVDLAFLKAGKIASVNKDVGDRVEPGDVIVALDNADLRAQVAQAQAQVAFQQAKLNSLQKGTRPEELQITQSKLASSQTDLAQSALNLLASLQDAYSKADDAIHNKTDEFFVNPRTSNPDLAFAQTVTTATSIESGRVEVELKLGDMQTLLSSASTSSDLPLLSSAVKRDMAEIKLFLDNTALAVNALTDPSYISQTTVSTWKTDLAAARTEVNAAFTAILTADSAYAGAQSSLSIAKEQLTLEQAGSVSDDIQAQQAEVDSARATVAGLQAQLDQTYIRSPLSGIVTKQDAKPGEIAPVGTPIVSVISDSKFQIEANVAEADIAKVAVAQKADVTLDAYGPDSHFQATVVEIDPAETIVDNVPTYKTTFQFDEPDTRIKSGMTANIDIKGDSHSGVLAVPQRAVITSDNKKYVRVKSGETIQEVPVTTGIRGEDGQVEITSGLEAGDTVAIASAGS